MHQGEGPSGSQPGGMHPGEGSGTQQPVAEDEFTQLKGLIFPFLERVGDNRILQGIVPRMLNDPDRTEAINNVRKQYNNLVYAYIELLANNNAIDKDINLWLKYLNQNMNNPNFAQENQQATNNITALEGHRQTNETLKNGLTADMQALYNYVFTLYFPNQPTQNLVAGTSGQGQHGQGHYGQWHYGQGQHGQGQHEHGQPSQSDRGQGRRGRGRRGGRRGTGPSN
uniref:Uncharacterized protein n=1 Tax=Meloidogyne javanica TaxID=6303 RepID=A0A915M2D5_MELJA